ncbi:MAG: hypothetical protein N2B03_08700, partial [Boseongicola sp.]
GSGTDSARRSGSDCRISRSRLLKRIGFYLRQRVVFSAEAAMVNTMAFGGKDDPNQTPGAC